MCVGHHWAAVAAAAFASTLAAAASADGNRYIINKVTAQPVTKFGLTWSDPYHKDRDHQGFEFKSSNYPDGNLAINAAVTLYCQDAGWRAWSLGPTAAEANPSDWEKKAPVVTALTHASFVDWPSFTKQAAAQCQDWMLQDLGKAPPLSSVRSATLEISWKLSVGGECIRTKIPFPGKVEAVHGSTTTPIRVECSYLPRNAYLDSEPLKLYWSGPRQDNFVTSTAPGEAAAKAAGYSFIRIESRVLALHAGGATSLNLYWNPTTQDNLSLTNAYAVPPGYSLVRRQGYVYGSPTAGTVPLKLLYSTARNDYFTTATAQGEADAKAAGYVVKATLGYVFPQK